MRLTNYRDSALRKCGMKELSVAALLTAQHASLLLEPLQNLPNLHNATLPLEREASMPRTMSSGALGQ